MKNLKWWLMTASLIAVAALATACGKKDEGGAVIVAAPAPAVTVTCTGCPTSMALLGSAVSKSISYTGAWEAEVTLYMYGDAAQISALQQQQGSGMSVLQRYNGPVRLNGTFYVKTPRTATPYGGCNIPVGYYDIQTQTAGTWNGFSFSPVQVMAVAGPATGSIALQIAFYQSFISPQAPPVTNYAGQQFPYSLTSNVMVMSSSAGGLGCYGAGGVYYF